MRFLKPSLQSLKHNPNSLSIVDLPLVRPAWAMLSLLALLNAPSASGVMSLVIVLSPSGCWPFWPVVRLGLFGFGPLRRARIKGRTGPDREGGDPARRTGKPAPAGRNLNPTPPDTHIIAQAEAERKY